LLGFEDKDVNVYARHESGESDKIEVGTVTVSGEY